MKNKKIEDAKTSLDYCKNLRLLISKKTDEF